MVREGSSAHQVECYETGDFDSGKWVKFGAFALAMVVRAAVGMHSYSGESTPPMFGDYEAQRHWMEVALHVPARDWYRNTPDNNLTHWGLDYPPLSGYASWIFGQFVQSFAPDTVALRDSHGHECERSRAAMRGTVLLADSFVLLPALSMLSPTPAVTVALLPALLLMDHAHFQYNGVSLGLCVLAFALYKRRRDAMAAAAYTTAVYFKHLCLYFALALFTYHLDRLCRASSIRTGVRYAGTVVGAISVLTVLSFAPWLHDKQLMLGLLRRLFPVARGLYEDKVANVWCSISVLVKLHLIFTQSQLLTLCTVTTVMASLPFCISLLRKRKGPYDIELACAGCGLAAFLFSFQVHEKQILIPLVALSLAFESHPRLVTWMSLAASSSLFPLLVREKLVLPYIAINLIHLCVLYAMWPLDSPIIYPSRILQTVARGIRALEFSATILGILLHAVLLLVKPPSWAPDILVLLQTSFSCAIFCGVYVGIVIQLWIRNDNSKIE